MDHILQYVFTIALSLFLSYVLSIFLSLVFSLDHQKRSVLRSHQDVLATSPSYGSECDQGLGLVAKTEQVTGLDEAEQERFVVRDSFSCSRGLPTIIEELVEQTPHQQSKADEISKSEDFGRDDMDLDHLVVDEVGAAQTEEEIVISEEIVVSECESKTEADCIEEALFDDDWEGIQRTEMDRVFGAAVCFVGSESNGDRISNLDGDTKLQLYGLHKIAIEGPCHEPQPMALKLSARAKWNAWQKLANMTPEVAMEQYISLLSRSIPGWRQNAVGGDDEHNSVDAPTYRKLASDIKAVPENQSAVCCRNLYELEAFIEGSNVAESAVTDFMNKDKQEHSLPSSHFCLTAAKCKGRGYLFKN